MFRNTRKGELQWVSRCYGIWINGSTEIVVRADRTRGRISCRAVAIDDGVFRSDLAAGVPVAGCISVRQSFSKWVEAPFDSAVKAKRVLPTVLDIQLPFALEDCVYEFIEETRRQGKLTSLAVGARKDDVLACIESYRARLCDPFVIDHAGLAIWDHSLSEMPWQNDESARIIVFMEDDQSMLVVGRDRVFLNAHSFRSGDMSRVSRLLRIALSDDAVSDLDRIRWLWAGSAARDSETVMRLMAEVSVMWGERSEVVNDPGEFLARAVAIRAMTCGRLRCNLRTGENTHPALSLRMTRQSMRSALVILAAGLILVVGSLICRGILSSQDAELKKRFEAHVDALAGYHVTARGSDAVEAVERQTKEKIARLQPFVDSFDQRIFKVIETVARISAKDGLICSTLSVRHGHVVVRGLAPSWNSCADLKTALTDAGAVAKLDRSEDLIDEMVPFTLVIEHANE
ncbi:MAG: hypothetical protein JXN60_06510 [Lentisphaerae bacterium]|nr:hypothetical protein [Lentisphaerota bacterium]